VDSARLAVHSPYNVDSRPRTSLPIATIFSLGQAVMVQAKVRESEPPIHISTTGSG